MNNYDIIIIKIIIKLNNVYKNLIKKNKKKMVFNLFIFFNYINGT